MDNCTESPFIASFLTDIGASEGDDYTNDASVFGATGHTTSNTKTFTVLESGTYKYCAMSYSGGTVYSRGIYIGSEKVCDWGKSSGTITINANTTCTLYASAGYSAGFVTDVLILMKI